MPGTELGAKDTGFKEKEKKNLYPAGFNGSGWKKKKVKTNNTEIYF